MASLESDILVIDDEPGAIQLMGRILSQLSTVRFATQGAHGLTLAREVKPDLILLDAEMPGMSGFEVCDALKADPALADVPVIFVTSHSDAAFEVAALGRGAADFITKPFTAPLVLARVRIQLRVKRQADELRQLAAFDSLTGLDNRRSFDEALLREWLRARRTGEPLALIMVDVDHFKLFNDSYGHPLGDACLREVAQALSGVARRPADLVARYGGEEFALLLPHTARAGAISLADSVVSAVTARGVPHATSPTARWVTVSAGVACYTPPAAEAVRSLDDDPARPEPAQLLELADRALYAAKHRGRARVETLDLGLARGAAAPPRADR